MADIKEITNRCLKCGFCLNVCPVYKELKEEIVSPRAKLRLIRAFKEGDIVNDKYLRKIITNCLMCETCFKNCPSGLHTPVAVLELRKEFKKKYGLDWRKKLLRFGLLNNRIRSLSAFWARIIYNNFIKKVSLNLPVGTLVLKDIPNIGKPLKGNRLSYSTPKKVFYYVGCLDRFMFSNTALSTIKVLNELGIDVEVSSKERCCGAPVIISGDVKTVLKNSRKNIDLFTERDYDYIITTCPTCAVTLKETYPEILKEYDEKEYLVKLNKIRSRIVDINEFLAKNKDLPRSLKEFKRRVTYHDPCHLVNTLGIYSEPREIIKSISGIDFVELKGGPSCCGSGGFYHIYFPRIAKKIGSRTLESIKKTEADIILTGCPACKLQLINLINNAKINTKVMHVVELLADCI